MRTITLLFISALALSGCTVAPRPVTLATPNGTVFIDDGGQGGVPILFVHGNGGNSQQWRAQLDTFRAHGHRAAAIDLPGFGKSAPAADGDYSLISMANAIERATQSVKLNRFVIVGHSYAGAVVAQYAATHPEKVAGVVYVDAAAASVPLTDQQKAQFNAALRADKVAVVRSWFAPMLKPSSSSVRDRVFASVESSSTDAFIGALSSLTSWQPATLINAYTGPRLAIVAADLENPMSFDKLFPNVETVRISGAGHWLMLDKPDEVNAAIMNFVERIPGRNQ
jgi:pimeloyl-ACP methyl ester carboxylesterase